MILYLAFWSESHQNIDIWIDSGHFFDWIDFSEFLPNYNEE